MKQRKIDNEVLRQMLSEDKTQRECATFFDVSDAAISKVVKRWQSDKLAGEMPESFKVLSPMKQRFVLSVGPEQKSRTAAAMDAFNPGSLASAKAMGQRTMSEPDIRIALADLMAQCGLTRRSRIHRLSDIVNAKDLAIASRGLDLSFKLDGSYAPIQIENVPFDAALISASVKELRQMLEEQSEEAKTIDLIPEEKEVNENE